MKILNETELMKNQKASSVVMPDKQFEALQTIEGNSLLFSIGTDNILYCTREVPGDTHGWVRVDLSSSLSAACYGGAAVLAKTFDIAQDLSSVNTVDIALVVTVNGRDHLHLATGFSNTLANWAAATPSFTQYPFDDYKNPSLAALPINDVQVADGNGSQFIIADIISNATAQTISRYYIDTSKTAYVDSSGTGYAWVPHNLSIDLQAGQIATLLGCGPNDGPDNGGSNIGGVYVLGKIDSTPQLMYAPTYNYVDPAMIQNPTIINLPAGTDASHMAIGLSAPAANAPYTDLFFASNGQLYFLANANQIDTETSKPTLVSVYQHSLFQNLQSLHVSNWNNNIVIWGQSLSTDGSGTSQLFIMEGVAGQETNAAAWSCPVPLLFNVENSASYVNNNYSADSSVDSVNGNAYGSCSVLFAHQEDGSLVQLFQDPITTAWQQRSLLTVPNDYTVMYETTTYTSHISITDDNNVPQGSSPVSIWASSPCSVFVNNVYTSLGDTNPLQTTADELGVVTITQPVDTIGGISYYISVQDPVTKQVYNEAINPVSGTMSSLGSKVPDSSHNYLSNVQVTDELGNTTPLVSSTISGTQATAASANIYTVCQQNANVNKDGLVTGQSWPNTTVSAVQAVKLPAPPAAKPGLPPAGKPVVRRTAKPDRQAKHIRFNPKTDKIWGCTFGKNAKHFEGIEALKEIGLVLHPDGSLSFAQQNAGLGSFLNAIETKAGHLFKWMKSEAQKLEQAVISFTDGVIDCLLTIAGSVYHFVIKCANDIANAAHTFLNAVETAFEDVVKWLGTIFTWNDIVRTHKVIKSFFTNYANYCIQNISAAQGQINYAASQAIAAIDSWAGIADTYSFPQDSYSSQSGANPPPNGQGSPSSNWGHTHLKDNAANAGYSSSDADPGNVLDDFYNGISTEFNIVSNAVNQLTGILSEAGTMPMGDLLKQIMAVIADAVIESGVNLIDTLLNVAADVIGDIINDVLAAPVNIPVLSNVYKMFAKDDLSMLDVTCLLAAIPLNVIYKLSHGGNTPFPDNTSTNALINATTFNGFIQAMPNAVPASVSTTMLQSNAPVWSNSANTFWTLIGNGCAMGGAIGVSVLGVLKTKFPSSKFVATMYAAFYVPYVAPDAIGVVQNFYNPQTNWYNYMNAGVATSGLIKSCVDIKLAKAADAPAPAEVVAKPVALNVKPTAAKPAKKLVGDDDDPPVPNDPPVLPAPNNPGPPPAAVTVPPDTPGWNKPFANGYCWNDASPIVEAIINLIWQVPVVFAYMDAQKQNTPYNSKVNTNNILSLTGNTMFDFGGIITPIGSFGPPPVNLAIMVTQVVMNLGYGAMSLATSLD